jgi:hypothetical protein
MLFLTGRNFAQMNIRDFLALFDFTVKRLYVRYNFLFLLLNQKEFE